MICEHAIEGRSGLIISEYFVASSVPQRTRIMGDAKPPPLHDSAAAHEDKRGEEACDGLQKGLQEKLLAADRLLDFYFERLL